MSIGKIYRMMNFLNSSKNKINSLKQKTMILLWLFAWSFMAKFPFFRIRFRRIEIQATIDKMNQILESLFKYQNKV